MSSGAGRYGDEDDGSPSAVMGHKQEEEPPVDDGPVKDEPKQEDEKVPETEPEVK